MSLGARWDAEDEAARPYLVMLAISDAPLVGSARHLLDHVDEVRFGRGERATWRMTDAGRNVLELRIPDPRMSSRHGRLVRGPGSWVLDDPESKNGAVIDGASCRRAVVNDGAVIELGHTFFVLRHAPVEAGATDDTGEADLAPGAAALATFEGELAERYATL